MDGALRANTPSPDFRSEVQAWQSILATEITADFRAATIREVIASIGRQSQANIVLSLDVQLPPAQPKELPTITRRFQRVPLRTVLFHLSRDAGLTIDWLSENDFPRAIRIQSQ